MSTSQIVGIVGGTIGFFIGGPMGAQIGYAIGSAVGAYVDPMKVHGPRLEDARAQTSTVGGIIPFGYGVFTCAGNVIWADRLVEHKKTERVGKGGGQKNVTYTYTRSYAIGVCEGDIYGYLWIKKNGKLVYAADPAGLGAAMGWTGKQISDLVAASAKFLQETTLYYGTDSQMPDSTIVAVEGVGNVSPFRDLAYIVKENEDLTDTAGAVSQYEFCIRATPPEAYLTSKVYPQFFSAKAAVQATLGQILLQDVLKEANASDDQMLDGFSFDGGGMAVPLGPNIYDKLLDSISITGGELKVPPNGNQAPDKLLDSISITGGELRVPPNGNQAPDKLLDSISITGGELKVP